MDAPSRSDRSARRFRRAIGALASVAVGAAALTAVVATDPQPAAAALGSSQALTNRVAYGPNEAIYASGNVTFLSDCKSPGRPPGVDDIFQPWADLYIIPTGTVVAGGGLRDVSGKPNVIFGGFAGGFVEELIGFTGPGGTIPAGTYDIVIDDCQDGVFDLSDSIMVGAFSVRVPIGTKPALVGAGTKARAAALADDYKGVAEAWKGMLDAIGNAKVAGAVSINAVSDISLAIFQAQAATILPDPREAMYGSLVQLSRANAGLAADPPDPAFGSHATVSLPAVVGDGLTGDPLEALLIDSARSASVDAALLTALVTAVERHQGAAQVGNGDWMSAHARDALALIDVLQDRAPITADLVRSAGDRYAQFTSEAGAIRSWLDQLIYRPAYFQRFGGDTLERQRAQNRGLTRAQVDQVYADLLELQPAAPFTNFTVARNRTAALADAVEAQAANLDELRVALETALSGVAAEGRDGPRPIASAGGPYSASTGTSVTVDGSGSTPSSASVPVVTYEWDLDLDGAFDDATGPTAVHTPMLAGNTVIGLRVTDESGATDVAFATIDVAAGDLPPTITAISSVPAATPAGSAAVQVERDAPFSLAITASDPEGLPVSVAWHRDGVPVGSGATFAAPALDSYGTVRFDALATDPAGNLATRTFVVTAFGPDADGDGWRVPADCDDSNAAVRPSRSEIVGNGIDDDCDPATVDDAVAPAISSMDLDSNASPTTGWQVGDEITLSSSWGHPLRYSGQPFGWTLDWGDGTTTSGSVSGTTFASTDIKPTHVYRSPGAKAVRLCITSPEPEPLSTCFSYGLYAGNRVLPAAPTVHPADLREWISEEVETPGGIVVGPGIWRVTPDGSSAITDVNQQNPLLLISDEELDTSDGPARFVVDLGTANTGDNDIMGIALGVQPGETTTDAADWVNIQFKGYAGSEPIGFCYPGGAATAPSPLPIVGETDPNRVVRFRGRGHYLEHFYGTTIAAPGPNAAPECQDEAGGELLASRRLPSPLESVGTGRYRYLRPPEEATNAGFSSRLYEVEVEYSPTELVVWMDDIELFRVAAPADDPFPQGRMALMTQSMYGVRFVGHRQAPREEAVQGEARDFTVEFADPGEVGQYTAVVEWGDGTPASVGTIEPIDGRPSHFTVTAEHAYANAGENWAEVCVTDQTDGLVGCGSVRVRVENAPPIVDAGADALTGADVTLEGATYRDPGIDDTHTATVDWGDGTPLESVEPTATATGAGIIDGAHTYDGPGSYTVEICVTDQDGAVGCDEREVEVRTERTEALAAYLSDGPTAPEGSTVEVGVAFTDSLPAATHTAIIDWGDGTIETVSDLVDRGLAGVGWMTHTYADDGVYLVTATVCDEAIDCSDVDAEDGRATASTTVTITNVAPLVDATWAVDGAQVTLAAAVADPGVDDTHTATIDWGDGTVESDVPVVDDAIDAQHTYLATGTYDVSVTVTDDDGGTGVDGDTIEITSVPVLALGVAIDEIATTPEGTPVTLSGTFSTPEGVEADAVTVAVTPAEGVAPITASVDAAAGTWSIDHTYPDDGTFVVAAEACAPGATCGRATAEATSTNVDPIVDAGGERQTTGALALDGVTFTDPGTADTHTATVDWGDGTPVQPATVVPGPGGGAVTGLHTYAEAGRFTVTVCVTDDDDGTGCDSFEVEVQADPSFEIEIDPVVPIDEGGTATVAFTVTGPPDASPSATVRWGDGTAPAPTPLTADGTGYAGSADHVYVQDGSFTATVEVCDGDDCGTAVVTVEVANVAPVVDTLTVSGAPAGLGAVQLMAGFADPGIADVHSATVDWGDGTTSAAVVDDRTVTATHTYLANGTFTVSVCVADETDDAPGCAETTVGVVDVPNAPPEVVLTEVTGTLEEGSPVTLTGSVADADADGPLALTVEWGDGTTTEASVPPGPISLVHTYANDGTYAITATVDDGFDADTAVLYGVAIANVAPDVELDTSVDDLTVTADVTASDPGDDDLSGTIDWGDGTLEDLDLDDAGARGTRAGRLGSAAAVHTYGSTGVYTVEACVRDDDGGRTCRSSVVSVGSSIDEPPEPVDPPPGDRPPEGTTPPTIPDGTTPPTSAPSSTPTGPIGDRPLVRTGAESSPLAALALGLMTLGAALLVGARGRRRLPNGERLRR